MEKNISSKNLEAGYKAIAADKEQEAEALEWCEAIIGDCLDDDESDFSHLLEKE